MGIFQLTSMDSGSDFKRMPKAGVSLNFTGLWILQITVQTTGNAQVCTLNRDSMGLRLPDSCMHVRVPDLLIHYRRDSTAQS